MSKQISRSNEKETSGKEESKGNAGEKAEKGGKRKGIVSKGAHDPKKMPWKRIKKGTRNKSLKLKVQKLVQVKK